MNASAPKNPHPLGGTDAARHGTGKADLTVMIAAHDAFRRDLRKLATAATEARTWSPDRQQAVHLGWQIFQRQLHVHHGGEDAVIWPLLNQRLAGSHAAASLLQEMEAEHARIDPLLAAVNRAFSFQPDGEATSMPDAGDAVHELATQLSQHLDHEERDTLPLIGQTLTAKEWSSIGQKIGRQSDQGISFVPEFFGWLLDGAAPDTRPAVLGSLPTTMRPLVTRVFQPIYRRRVNNW